MRSEPRITRTNEPPVIEPAPGFRRKTLVWGDGMLLVEVSLQKGTIIPAHQHFHEQIGYVLKGRLRFTLNGQLSEASMGDGYIIPSHTIHHVEALEDCVVIDVFSPTMDEFKWWSEYQRDAQPPSGG